jgi:hypothetical protein
MARTAKEKTEKVEPSTALANAALKLGWPARVMWEIPGPKNTSCAWLTCYALGKLTPIVQTFNDGTWAALFPLDGMDEILAACGIAPS